MSQRPLKSTVGGVGCRKFCRIFQGFMLLIIKDPILDLPGMLLINKPITVISSVAVLFRRREKSRSGLC
jgi:hypothetical protein